VKVAIKAKLFSNTRIYRVLHFTINQGLEKVKSSDKGIIFMIKLLIPVSSVSIASIGVTTPCSSTIMLSEVLFVVTKPKYGI